MSQSSGPSGFDNPWLAATVGLVLLAIAIGFALGAGRLGTHLASRPSMEAARAQRSAVGQWPAVPATLQRLTLVKMQIGRAHV